MKKTILSTLVLLLIGLTTSSAEKTIAVEEDQNPTLECQSAEINAFCAAYAAGYSFYGAAAVGEWIYEECINGSGGEMLDPVIIEQ